MVGHAALDQRDEEILRGFIREQSVSQAPSL